MRAWWGAGSGVGMQSPAAGDLQAVGCCQTAQLTALFALQNSRLDVALNAEGAAHME